MGVAYSSLRQDDLWSLVYGTPWVDARTLLAAVERELRSPPGDFRSRVLLRDSIVALGRKWGAHRLESSLPEELHDRARRIGDEDLGPPGFPSLEKRITEATEPEIIFQFLRELGDALRSPARLDVGGSSALIVRGLLRRATEAIDAADEVPAAIRVEHEKLRDMAARFRLRLTHFRSRYLPQGWDCRAESFGRFGALDVFMVHPMDIFVGKLFSKRIKDCDDLRMLIGALDRSSIEDRLRRSAHALLAHAALRADAEKNWSLLFGDPFPA